MRARLEDDALTGVERQELHDGLARIEKRLERLDDRLLQVEAAVNQTKGAATAIRVLAGFVGFNTILAFLAFAQTHL